MRVAESYVPALFYCSMAGDGLRRPGDGPVVVNDGSNICSTLVR